MGNNWITPFDQVEYMERLERMKMETFDEMVERIARAWIARPCPPDEQAYCNPAMHVWETMHPEDQAWAREHVAFALKEAGL